jgi:hypothetical protein
VLRVLAIVLVALLIADCVLVILALRALHS